MSATDLIEEFAEDVTLTRYGTGGYENGSYAAGSTSVSSIRMSVQPLGGRDLLNLPEAQRTKIMMKGYCADQLLTAQSSPSQKADVITHNGIDYEVQAVEPWTSGGSTIAPFWKVTLAGLNP